MSIGLSGRGWPLVLPLLLQRQLSIEDLMGRMEGCCDYETCVLRNESVSVWENAGINCQALSAQHLLLKRTIFSIYFSVPFACSSLTAETTFWEMSCPFGYRPWYLELIPVQAYCRTRASAKKKGPSHLPNWQSSQPPTHVWQTLHTYDVSYKH